METLSHKDLLALNRAIGEIYTARDMESFYRSSFNSIQSIIPSEHCSFNDVILHPTRFLKVTASSQMHNNVIGKHLTALNTHLHEHPLNPHFLSDTPVKTSDYSSKNRFVRLALYNEYYKHLDIETQIVFSIPVSREKTALVALSRKSPDFSERDRLILALLKPHLISALRNVMEHSSTRLAKDLLHKSAEAEKQGAVLFQSNGKIVCISPFAKKMFAKYFNVTLDIGNALPKRLLKWFKIRELSKSVEREALTLEKENNILLVRLINDFTTGDNIFVVTETSPTARVRDLTEYDLSSRETEVLTWLAKGKSNIEIAMILSISKRTAEKHMENIFAKLGVETRAAAATAIR